MAPGETASGPDSGGSGPGSPERPGQSQRRRAEGADLEAALQQAARPYENVRIRGGSVRSRVYATTALHRLVPTALAVFACEQAAKVLAWLRPEALEQTRHANQRILSHTTRASEAGALALPRLAADLVREEMLWRPWALRSMQIEGWEHLADAHLSGRGVVISFLHMGPAYFGIPPALARHGIRSYMVAAPYVAHPDPTSGALGRLAQRRRNNMQDYGASVIDSRGSFPVVRELLNRGNVVCLAFDFPGSVEVELLGKPVMLTSGTARLAIQTGCLLVPAVSLRRGRFRSVIRLEPPIEAGEHDDEQAVVARLAAVMERLILDAPETQQDPAHSTTWAAGAGVDAWKLP